jgi:hypothetical protein
MTTAHSPAPWSIDRGQLRDRDGNALAQVPIFPDGIGGPEDLANGQLMAAAPDMAEALRIILYQARDRSQPPRWRFAEIALQAQAALERAGLVQPEEVPQ